MTGYFRRMQVYLREMFPLPAYVLVAALTYLGVEGFARLVQGERSSLISLHGAAGI